MTAAPPATCLLDLVADLAHAAGAEELADGGLQAYSTPDRPTNTLT
jgi:hypothetical protein